MTSRASNLIAELTRRRVFRTAAVYGVIAWLLIQVAATVFPALHLPGWTVTLAIALLVLGFPLALGLAWVLDITPGGVVRTGPSDANHSQAPQLAPKADAPGEETADERIPPIVPDSHSIAVLPFVNMSADPEQEFFSDGLTEEILNALAHIPQLRVTARTSAFVFKGKNVPIGEIAGQLRVRYVLEGSVRKSGQRLRIAAQLIDAANDAHLWSQTYDRELSDVFAIQDEISRAIAAALKVRLPAGAQIQLVNPGIDNVEAHSFYLRGLFHRNKPHPEELFRAIRYFEEAIRLEPKYAEAFAGLAYVYAVLPVFSVFDGLEAIRRGRPAADRALELNSKLAAAWAARAMLHDIHHPDWAAWEREICRAIELNPGYAPAHSFYSIGLRVQSRLDEAGVHIRRAIELDPIASDVNSQYGVFLLVRGDLRSAIAQLERTLELEPHFGYALGHLLYALVLAGEADRAVQASERLARIEGHDRDEYRTVVHAIMGEGERAPALEILDRWGGGPHPGGMRIAALYALLGHGDRAMDWLERCYAERVFNIADVAVEPQFVSLRREARYEALLRKLALETHEGPKPHAIASR